MAIPNRIREMWRDAYNLLAATYADDKQALIASRDERFYEDLLDQLISIANKFENHPMAKDLLIAVYEQAERMWKEKIQ